MAGERAGEPVIDPRLFEVVARLYRLEQNGNGVSQVGPARGHACVDFAQSRLHQFTIAERNLVAAPFARCHEFDEVVDRARGNPERDGGDGEGEDRSGATNAPTRLIPLPVIRATGAHPGRQVLVEWVRRPNCHSPIGDAGKTCIVHHDTEFPDDQGLRAVLDRFGVKPSDLLGHGGEAWVYALGDQRVLRVLHGSGSCDHVSERQALVDELRRGAAATFELPQVLECGSVAGRSYAIERRLPGVSVGDALGRLARPERRILVERHLDAAHALGDLHLDDRPWFGELMGTAPVRTSTWRAYLVAKVTKSLSQAPGFEHLDPAGLAADLPDLAEASFVHLDAFAGNMLSIGPEITAVIDFGATSIRGDRRIDPLSAAVYLCAPPITPHADDDDRRVALAWLANAGLAEYFEPTRRWIAGFWAWATDDRKLHEWCRTVLL